LERKLDHVDKTAIPEAEWVLADACELSLLEAAHLENYDVVIAATGDDKANLVLSLLARPSSASIVWSRGSTIHATNGCSTAPGVSTSPYR
ncbi:NAD-binding protein, partial [Pseudomonas fluorescens]|uniref:NAD-binding protein n=1 Tax=Pseudomonas fluorescens TaxID=294 RepID=UPI002B1E7576